jgi:hypothetical protein
VSLLRPFYFLLTTSICFHSSFPSFYNSFSFAIFCSAVVRGFSSASLFGNAIFAFFGLSTGFFIVTSQIPVWLRWIKYLAYPNLGYSILASNEFTNNVYACPYLTADGSRNATACAAYDGNTILVGQLGLKMNYYPSKSQPTEHLNPLDLTETLIVYS